MDYYKKYFSSNSKLQAYKKVFKKSFGYIPRGFHVTRGNKTTHFIVRPKGLMKLEKAYRRGI